MNPLKSKSSFRGPAEEECVGATYCSTLLQMLPLCDFVVIICPLTPATTHMFGATEFQAMKTTGTLINISRGKLIDLRAIWTLYLGFMWWILDWNFLTVIYCCHILVERLKLAWPNVWGGGSQSYRGNPRLSSGHWQLSHMPEPDSNSRSGEKQWAIISNTLDRCANRTAPSMTWTSGILCLLTWPLNEIIYFKVHLGIPVGILKW